MSLFALLLALSTAVSVPVGAEEIDTPSEQMVERMYQSILDRAPESEGLEFWSTELDRGTDPAAMLDSFLSTPEGSAKKPDVADIYERTLLRAPDATGLGYWKSIDYSDAVVAITNSEEAANVWDHEVFVSPSEPSPESDFVTRLYVSLLNRQPDAAGRDHWAGMIQSGTHPSEMLAAFLATPEGASKKPSIAQVYERTLLRSPDADGLAYWQSMDYTDAVLGITASAESSTTWGHYSYKVPPLKPAGTPDYFVETKNGVWVPPILLSIRSCESHDNYTAHNRTSSASGAYQFLDSTWSSNGHAARYGTASADAATPAQQDEAALITWQSAGTRPWYPSRSCWG